MLLAVTLALGTIGVLVSHRKSFSGWLERAQNVATLFADWIGRQDRTTIAMLLLVLLLLDLVPLAGHFVVKPFQLAFPLVYPIHVAVSLLVTFVFTSCMNALMVGRLLLRERVRRWAAGVATFHAMDRAITKHGGLRLVVLFRLTPLPGSDRAADHSMHRA